jgi:chlorobactene glucosyltransferase
MIAAIFLYQNMEIVIWCILFSLIIFSCTYLYRLSYSAHFSIPFIKSEQGKWFHRYNLKSKEIKICSMVKNNTNKYQKYRMRRKNNHNPNKYDYLKQIRKNKRISLSKNEQKNLPFVSIVVPARNEEKSIERCIISLLNQDYPEFEIIVIDDNSTDNTSKILKNIKDNTTCQNVSSTIEAALTSSTDKLNIITLKSKPEGWTGKTWASQKGFLKSKGELILFTDADTYYSKRDTILQTVSYMQREKLDVLTGIPTSEKLTNFWSKITIPMWDFIGILFGVGSAAEVNNPKSKFAYLMGCFFLIKRKVFLDVGTFESVHQEIQEDKALGIIIKEQGYKLRLVKLKDMVYTLWADDLVTLWHGIGRTVAPLVLKNKPRIVINLLIIFLCCILPFILFPFALSVSLELLFPLLFTDIHEIPFHFEIYLPILSSMACFFVLVFSSIKGSERGIPMTYTLGTPFGSIFVFIACLYNVIPLLIYGNTKPIMWQGRQYIYKKEQEGLHYSVK